MIDDPTDCQGNIVPLFEIADGPFRVEYVGCELCKVDGFVFVHDGPHTASVTTERGLSPEDAARQGMEVYLGLREPVTR